jgi:glucoamylase
LHWTSDDWQHRADTTSRGTAIGIEFVDIRVHEKQKGPIRFTFLWLELDCWEGKDYTVNVLGAQEVAANSSGNSGRKRKAQREPAA